LLLLLLLLLLLEMLVVTGRRRRHSPLAFAVHHLLLHVCFLRFDPGVPRALVFVISLRG
jgi:hypothetical protein